MKGFIFVVIFFISCCLFAEEVSLTPSKVPMVGSWTFSGIATNESGDNYGYFFQMQRHGSKFYAKTALIDAQTNKLLLFYEGNEILHNFTSLNWHVGRSFIRYNSISDSWIFGVTEENKKGFNFKVDMLSTENKDKPSRALRPGVQIQTIETTRLNGHIQTGEENKEQFVTGNKAWFAKLWFSQNQKKEQDVSTTLCRLNNDRGFYSANLTKPNAAKALMDWRDASGSRIKNLPFVSFKSLATNASLLNLGLPKLKVKLLNTLKTKESLASPQGLSQRQPTGFCFVEDQSFHPLG